MATAVLASVGPGQCGVDQCQDKNRTCNPLIRSALQPVRRTKKKSRREGGRPSGLRDKARSTAHQALVTKHI